MIQNFKKNCFFDHSVNFLVNFLSKDFAQNFRNENLEGQQQLVKISCPGKFWNPLFSSRLQIIDFCLQIINFFQSLQMAQLEKLDGFQRFLIFFPSHWFTRLPDLVIFRRFLKMKSWSIFSTLADCMCFIMHSMIVLIDLDCLTTSNYLI